ncbi:peptidyl-alpha-hydroxyglycine alpha-amidating lyase 1-like isoform X2 [Leptopilina boulardi]|uniref:peptidyl-alpha-hydroxyglycine alpha-amidating lyase 1-like isoform X2 n=1 Tax=Leptopilina boulardi TaxID=63433 RepID=UPI0021F574A2|nr:peptidyl-alpha-hydroxyglycine alpha-amidating lyase 1-like isoform X2 [Leptopilina boulardi]
MILFSKNSMSHSVYTSVYSLVLFFIIFEIQAFNVPDQYFKRAVNLYRDSKYRNDIDNYQEIENERMLDPIFNIRNYNSISRRAPLIQLEGLDPKIQWNKTWGSQLNLGQVSAVSIDPQGNVAIFHRGSRVWDGGSFNGNNEFDFNNEPNCGPVKESTIILLDKNGNDIFHWGGGIFYMPHGLTIDHLGNYWITDVAMHQVFKFDANDIAQNREQLMKNSNRDIKFEKCADFKNSFNNSLIKPKLILGTPFKPGSDNDRFCKPTSVAVMKNGDFFVADGYCNSRIIKYNSKGERILSWGRSDGFFDVNPSPDTFNIPHALALAEEFGYLYVADREHGRILCFHTSNGSFHKEYKNKIIGGAIYSVDYAQEKLFLVNGPSMDPALNKPNRGFIIDLKTDEIISEFAPNGAMGRPHDIAVTHDGLEIYVVELDKNRVTRFDQDRNSSSLIKSSDLKTIGTTVPDFKSALLTDIDINKTSGKSSSLVFSLIVSLSVLIVISILLAVIVSRWKKRGCLLTSRRRTIWETERKDNFKLTSLLENKAGRKFKFFEKRPNTRDFSKLNTEPETSEDEHLEDKLVTFYVNDNNHLTL